MPDFTKPPYPFESFLPNKAGKLFNGFEDHSILKPWNVVEVNESDKYYGLSLIFAQKLIATLKGNNSNYPIGFIMCIFNSLLTAPDTPITTQTDKNRCAFPPELKEIYKGMESLGYVKILAKPTPKMNPDGQEAIYSTITKEDYIKMIEEYSAIKRAEYRKAKQLLTDI